MFHNYSGPHVVLYFLCAAVIATMLGFVFSGSAKQTSYFSAGTTIEIPENKWKDLGNGVKVTEYCFSSMTYLVFNGATTEIVYARKPDGTVKRCLFE